MKLFANMSLLEKPFVWSRRVVRVAVLALTLTGGCLLGMGGAQAQTVFDYYNFNNGQTSGTALSTPVTHATNSGGGSGPTNSAITTNFSTPSTNFQVLSGSTLNIQNQDVAGNALAVLGGAGATGTAGAGTGGNNGAYIQLSTSTTGYTVSNLSYATRGTSTGFTTQQLIFSTNNFSTQTVVGSITGRTSTSFSTQTFDLSSYTALNNMQNVSFRITFTGASDPSGNNRIDNLTLSGNAITPAPPGVVSAGIGFGVTGLSALLRRRRQSKSVKAAEATA